MSTRQLCSSQSWHPSLHGSPCLVASGRRAAPALCADASAPFQQTLELHHMCRETTLVLVTRRPFILNVSVTHQNDTDSGWSRRGLSPKDGDTCWARKTAAPYPHTTPYPHDSQSHVSSVKCKYYFFFYRQTLVLVRLVAYPNCSFILQSPEKEAIQVLPQKGCSVKQQLIPYCAGISSIRAPAKMTVS